MPIAKTAPQPITQQGVTSVPVQTNDSILYQYDGIDADAYRYFNIEIGRYPKKELTKIREIWDWAKSECEDPTSGNVVMKVSRIEQQLGSPSGNDKRWDKIWNWVHITKKMRDLDNSREALRKRWAI